MIDDESRLVDDYLDPWLEGALSDPGTGHSSSESAKLSDRARMVADCARLVDRVWHANGGPPTASVDEEWRDHWRSQYPKTVGRFQIRRELGRGGGGVVYLAFDPTLAREVALKLPQPNIMVSKTLRERFQREARAAASLNHPNVVSVYETGSVEGMYYIASAYCRGPTLHRYLAGRDEPLPITWAVQLVHDLALGVQHAHQRGVLHRDLKPGNVLLEPPLSDSSPGRDDATRFAMIPKITDFGLALLVECESGQTWVPDGEEPIFGATDPPSQQPLTRTGTILGTASYMAPEQAHGRQDGIGRATDIHGLGVILFELLTGSRPFERASYAETLDAIRRDEPVQPRSLRSEIPRDLQAICLRCLEKDARRRYESAEHLAADLRRFLDGETVLARPVGTAERTMRWIRRYPAWATTIVVSVCALALLITGLFWHNQRLNDVNMRLNDALIDARRSHREAINRESQLRELWYAGDMRLAHQAWLERDMRHYETLLQRHRPAGDAKWSDHWEWWYLRQLGHVEGTPLYSSPGALYTTACSRTARRFFVGGQESTMSVIDAVTGAVIQEVATGQKEINGLSLSPDEKLLAVSGDDGTIQIRNALTGEQIVSSQISHEQVFGAVFSPDQKLMAIGGREPVVRLWDVDHEQVIAELAGHEREVEMLAFSPDGRQLVSASSDRTLIVWDVPSKSPQFHLRGHQGRVSCVAFSPDGRLLASGALDRHIMVWDSRTGDRLFMATHLDEVQSLTFLPGGYQIVAGDRGGAIRIWDLPSSERGGTMTLASQWQAHDGRVYSVSSWQNGTHILSCGSDCKLRIWRRRKSLEPTVLADSRSAPRSRVQDIAVTADGKTAVIAYRDGIVLRRLSDGRQTAKLVGNAGDWRAVAPTPDGKRLVSATESGQIVVWDLGREQIVSQWRFAGDLPLSDRTLVRCNHSTLAVVTRFGDSDHLRFFDLMTGEVLPSPGPTPCDAVAFAPNGRDVVIDYGHDLVCWDLRQRRERWRVEQIHESTINDIRFSDDGELIATASGDRQFKLWDAATGKLLQAFSGQRAPVTAVHFTPGHHGLITADKDGLMTLWHVATGQKLFDIARNVPTVVQMWANQQTTYLVIRSGDNPVAKIDFGLADLSN